ncbi:IS3 family transposase [Propionibacterium acidifaciens]
MCRWVKVSKSGYYAWRNRPESSTTRRREDLTAIIVKFFDESEQTCGYRRIHAELARSGVKVSLDMVRKIMAAAGPVARQPRGQARTDRAGARLSRPARPVAPRRHRHRARNEMGGRHHAYSNLAGIRPPGGRHGLLLGEGSSGTRSPVTCAPDSSPRPRPWPRRARPPIRGVTVLHSDRGARCTSAEYTKFMTGRGILPSVGRTGSCCDNAAAESFNAILKKELVNRKAYPTRNHAIRDVTARIESRYTNVSTRRSITRPPTKSTQNGDNNTRQQPETNH